MQRIEDYNSDTCSVRSSSTTDSHTRTPEKSTLQLVDEAIQNQKELEMMLRCLISVMPQPNASISTENS